MKRCIQCGGDLEPGKRSRCGNCPFDISTWRAANRTRLVEADRNRRRARGAKERVLVTQALIEQVQTHYKAGMKPPEIADIIDLSVTTVYRCIGGIRSSPELLPPVVRLPLYEGCQPVRDVGGARYLNCVHYGDALRKALDWEGFSCPLGCIEYSTEEIVMAAKKEEEPVAVAAAAPDLTELRRAYGNVERTFLGVQAMLASVQALDTVDSEARYKSHMLELANEMATKHQEYLDSLNEAMAALGNT